MMDIAVLGLSNASKRDPLAPLLRYFLSGFEYRGRSLIEVHNRYKKRTKGSSSDRLCAHNFGATADASFFPKKRSAAFERIRGHEAN